MKFSRSSKRAVSALAAVLLLSACGGDEQSEAESSSSATDAAAAPAPVETPPAAANEPEAVDVAALEKELQGLGCFACHAVSEKRVGPSYRDIAEKYRGQEGAAQGLTMKIIAGGGGVWGPVPMIAHPHLTPDQVTPLVEQILLIE